MPEYQGSDPIIPIIDKIRELKDSATHHLFNKNLPTTIDQIVEDAAFQLETIAEYETHYRRTYFEPISKRSEFTLYGGPNDVTSVPPTRPSAGSFVTQKQEYPREVTVRTLSCPSCETGTHTCPNCESEERVTCPDCHRYRNGECSTCTGSGRVTCPECSGRQSCLDCDGSGRVACSGCSGSGTVQKTKKIKKKCPECLGHDNECSTCRGRGDIKESVTETVTHDRCNGDGRVTCSNCGGSGKCPTCNGAGKVACSNCGGSGKCPTCNAAGTKQCPTCHGNGPVTCPMCEGETELFTCTADVYEYEPIVDTDEPVPEDFKDAYKSIRQEGGKIELEELTEDDVRSNLGLLNARLKQTLENARSAYKNLVSITEARQFDNENSKSDTSRQADLITNRAERVTNNWESENSDDYHANYKLSVSSRSEQSSDFHKALLYRARSFTLIPLSLVEIAVGEDKQQLYGGGTQSEYTVDDPNFQLSPPKVSLLGGMLAAFAVCVYTITSGQTYGLGSVAAQVSLTGVIPPQLPTLGILAGATASLCAIGYSYLVNESISKEREDLVLVVAEQDVTITTFLTVLTHTLSLEEMGVVRDELYTKLSKNLFDDVHLGASITISMETESGGLTRLVGMNWSRVSESGQADEVAALAEDATGIIGLIGAESSASFANSVESYADDLGTPAAFVLSEDAADVDLSTSKLSEVPLESLRTNYLDDNEESEVEIVDPIEAVK